MSVVLLAVATLSTCTPPATPSSGGGSSGTVTVPGELVAPSLLRLPYVEVGATPSATLTIQAAGAVEDFQVLVDGPFEVTGSTTALADGASRDLGVSYTGGAWQAANAVGTLTLRSDSGDVSVAVGAVVGDPQLPEDVVWEDDGYGLSATVPLPSAPFPDGDGPWTDDSVYLWLPHTFAPGFGVVTHLHGHYTVLASMLEAKELPDQFRLSDRNALFVVPQGPVNAASGDFGKLMDPGGHAALVRDAIALLYREGLVELPEPGAQVITAHSGGYRAAARIVEHGGLDVAAVHLFDALYGEIPTFEDFALEGGTLRSIHTPYGGTRSNNLDLLADLEEAGLEIGENPLTDGCEGYPVTITPTSAPHDVVMAFQNVYARWLEHSGLPEL